MEKKNCMIQNSVIEIDTLNLTQITCYLKIKQINTRKAKIPLDIPNVIYEWHITCPSQCQYTIKNWKHRVIWSVTPKKWPENGVLLRAITGIKL